MSTPRLFLARHGETAWTLTGQHTGITDLPLTAHGEFQVASSRTALVGLGRLIDPSRLSHIYVSPRLRAQRTLQLLLGTACPVVDERVREWGYGRYEGMTPSLIREDRLSRGLDTERPFNIWRDGCENASDGVGAGPGESKQEISARIDDVIGEVREIHRAGMETGSGNVDVLIVSHGHFLRSLAKRWLGFEVDANLSMILEPGGIATLT
jgi:probable phosphoglycerate mutase